MKLFDALIVSHGQPSSIEPAEQDLATFVAQVQAHIPDINLGAVTLAAPNRLEETLQKLTPGGVIYPLFMSDGWFVRTYLAGRLKGADVKVMQPFGMAPELPELVANGLREIGVDVKNLTEDAPIFLVAHGSGSGNAAPERATRDFAKKLQRTVGGTRVEVGFIEQSPTIEEVMRGLKSNLLCLPFFAMEGDHVRKDIHETLASVGFTGRVLPVISKLPGIDVMIAHAIQKPL
jgi:sirohydrochlorin ferrochelatase